jgi:hypothetical protein
VLFSATRSAADRESPRAKGFAEAASLVSRLLLLLLGLVLRPGQATLAPVPFFGRHIRGKKWCLG